jgi:cytochrome P450
MALISRMSASIFVGPELAANQDWQDLTVTYTVNVFTAVAALCQWPAPLRRLVHHFLPYSKICKKQVTAARTILAAVLDDRAKARDSAIAEGRRPPEHDDTLTWVSEATAGRPQPIDHAAVQLAFAISALHTTSEAFRHVLLDLCIYPELVQPLREEIKNVMGDNNPDTDIAALSKLHLLDGVMKESQRLKGALVGIERRVVCDTVMPSGLKLPAGSNIAVDSSDMFSPAVHSDPAKFDGYRFPRMRERGHSSMAAFVNSSKEHNVFGAGRFICPGRFFVANEMKIALVQVLMRYDLRLKDGKMPKEIWNGFYFGTNLGVEVEVRRKD